MKVRKPTAVLALILVATNIASFYVGKMASQTESEQTEIANHHPKPSERRQIGNGRGQVSDRSRFSPDERNELVTSDAPRLKSSSISSSGRLTSEAAKAFGMTTEEKHHVDQAIGKAFRTLTKSIAERAVLDEARSDEANGVTAYVIPAMEDGGEALRNSLKADLQRVLGNQRGDNFFTNFNYSDTFNAFGACDSSLEITEEQEPIYIGQPPIVGMYNRDPKSGETVWSYASNFDVFKEKFGESFTAIQDD
jgi:hypothetical protein